MKKGPPRLLEQGLHFGRLVSEKELTNVHMYISKPIA